MKSRESTSSRRGLLVSVAFAVALVAIDGSSVALSRPPLDAESLREALVGLDHLYHARPRQAAEWFEKIRARHPSSPAPDFLLGGIQWHILTTGPQGFAGGGPAEREFYARMDAAIEQGEARIETDPDDLSARFFTGGAYGYKARHLALKEKWWDAYRTGRKGVKHLEHVVERDPDFADAYLGLGIYHYYSDVLPSVLKFLGKIVGVNGDRERGLREIRRALTEGELVEAESRFFLAEIHTTFEEDHWRAFGYSASLRDDYPENELYVWLNARVLDELHLVDLSIPEWRRLMQGKRSRSLRGFLDYRMARAKLFGGDFVGAGEDLGRLLEQGRLGSDRITMWGRLRYGVTLDFQGRHEEAYRQYELAREVDASDTAKDRVNERLSAGKRDPSVVSLTELEEAVRIVKETGTHEESELAALESRITSPSRGLTSSEIERYFDLLGDLAEARLRRRDPEGCVAAVDRALDLERRAPKESRAKLLALRARALHRIGRTEEALEDLRTARSRASWNWKKRIEHDRRLVGEDPPPGPPRPATPSGGEATTFATRDRGEIRLEIEGSFLPSGERLPLKLVEGTWTASWPVPAGTEIRYRYVADDRYTRPDPLAERTILENDEAWSVRYVGSESAHGVSRDTRNPAPPENPPRSDTRESRPERP